MLLVVTRDSRFNQRAGGGGRRPTVSELPRLTSALPSMFVPMVAPAGDGERHRHHEASPSANRHAAHKNQTSDYASKHPVRFHASPSMQHEIIMAVCRVADVRRGSMPHYFPQRRRCSSARDLANVGVESDMYKCRGPVRTVSLLFSLICSGL